jgi:4-amino-4-deoxy-L-arabinose transferase-like glycosyltransferase
MGSSRSVAAHLSARSGRSSLRRWTVAFPLVLVAAYALQVASPLRLTVDSVGYLTMADSISEGHGVPPHAPFPIGLPAMYALLAKVGLQNAWAIVALNVAFASVAALCAIALYRRAFAVEPRTAMVLCAGLLLSFVVVKYAALALSDIPFLAFTLAALLGLTCAIQEQRRGRAFAYLAVGVVLVGCAITIRSAGVALISAAVVAAFETVRRGAPIRAWWTSRAALLTSLGCLAGVAAVAYTLSSSRYFKQAGFTYGRHSIWTLLSEHIHDWGQLGMNVPLTHLPSSLHGLLLPAGLVVIAIILGGLWSLRHAAAKVVHVFTISYLVLIFVWPYTDPRFWMPLLAPAIGYAHALIRRLAEHHRVVRLAAAAYVVAFAGLGLAALEHETSVSYAGSSFPQRYGSPESTPGSLQSTYRVAFGEARPGDGLAVNEAALAILRRWDARARRGPR